MTKTNRKSLMRNLGEFFGHVFKAVRSNPDRRVIRKDVEEETRDSMTLRRTTIEEVEFKRPKD